MIFIVILIAMLIERFFDWSHLRYWQWYRIYQKTLYEKLSATSSYIAFALMILPLPILIGIIDHLLRGWVYGFICLIFELVILLYCLGPRNFWADAFAEIYALSQGDLQMVGNKLKADSNHTYPTDAQGLHHAMLSELFVEANRRVFAVMFWFAIVGPIGALFYRLVALAFLYEAQNEMSSAKQPARFMLNLIDWLPARVLSFIFALGGHFVQVLSVWQRQVLQGLANNESLLAECGMAALDATTVSHIAEDGSAEKEAVGLIDRSLIIFLVLVAIMVLLV